MLLATKEVERDYNPVVCPEPDAHRDRMTFVALEWTEIFCLAKRCLIRKHDLRPVRAFEAYSQAQCWSL